MVTDISPVHFATSNGVLRCVTVPCDMCASETTTIVPAGSCSTPLWRSSSLLIGIMRDSFRNGIDSGTWITDGMMSSKIELIDGSRDFSFSKVGGSGTLAMVRVKGRTGGDR